ncbi:MAG: glycosyltransferase family 39 protein [Bryobacterales bacterium]|nr:glycosyltransferase family 39 protein [Bryobacterales bacterium]
MRRGLIVLAAVFAAIVLFQTGAGVYRADFDAIGGDEAAHFVTGLLVHDYVSGSLGAPPIPFAERFYLHYPKVAFGIWPPLFHVLEGAWFLLFGPSRLTAMLLVAFLSAAMAWVLYRESESRLGVEWAAVAVAMTLLTPLTYAMNSFFGADALVSLLMFGAAVAWSRYVTSGLARHSAAFGLLAGLAILSKYNALALALLPPLSALLVRRGSMLRQRSFWLPLPIVLAVAGPWYLFSWNMVRYAADMGEVEVSALASTGEYLTVMVERFGIAILLVAGLGWARALVRNGPEHARDSVMGAFVAALLIFHSVIYPFAQDRYLFAAVPATALLCAGTLRWLAGAMEARRRPVAAVAALAIVAPGAWAPGGPAAPDLGPLSEVAASMRAQLLDRPGQHVLISSSGVGEGAFVAAVAVGEPRPGTQVLRGSKVLSSSTWMNAGYRLLYDDPEELERRLDELRVTTIVLDSDPQRPHHPHQSLLSWMLLSGGGPWKLVRTFETKAPQGRERFTRIYRRAAPYRFPAQPVEVDMRYSLGRSIRASR